MMIGRKVADYLLNPVMDEIMAFGLGRVDAIRTLFALAGGLFQADWHWGFRVDDRPAPKRALNCLMQPPIK